MAELIVPRVDFSPLGELPQLIQQNRQNQLRQQTLASLGQGTDVDANTLIRSGDLSLAQLGVAMRNRSADDAWRLQEAERSQKNADRSYGIQVRAADRADDPTPTGFIKTDGGVTPIAGGPADPKYIAEKDRATSNKNFLAEVEQRKQVAAQLGMTPEHPAYNAFIATGKMPREDAQPLTAGDKEAIRTADDAVMSNRAAIDSLNRAKTLSKQAFSGPGAGIRGSAASFLGETSDIGKSGIATENLTNEVMTNALGQLKAIFGGNPTEGERRILLDLQGSVSKPDVVRQEIFNRAINAAQKRLEFNQKRADELRGNTYYKPKAAQPQQAAPAQGGVVDWQTYFGSGQ